MLVGQRGWETENVVDMLDRCPALRGVVIERNHVPDAEMARLLKGSRALLLPSFAEGFGFPLVEALGLGVPALCSDLPALRETGGDVPEFLDPLDGRAWRDAIIDYHRNLAPAAAQLARLAAGSRRVGRIISPLSIRLSPDLRSRQRNRITVAECDRRGHCQGLARRQRHPAEMASDRRQIGRLGGDPATSSSKIRTASRTCSSLCCAVKKKRSRAARSGTAG